MFSTVINVEHTTVPLMYMIHFIYMTYVYSIKFLISPHAYRKLSNQQRPIVCHCKSHLEQFTFSYNFNCPTTIRSNYAERNCTTAKQQKKTFKLIIQINWPQSNWSK